MRHVGVHLRLTHTLADLFTYAQQEQLKTFQCFLVHQSTYSFYRPTAREIQKCKKLSSEFVNIYLHGAYGINLADCVTKKQHAFERELKYAVQLGFTHYVLHPGSFKFAPTKEAAIECLARRLDDVIQYDPPITFILENVAHAGKAIGGDFHDFYLLKQAMNHGSKISFCLDTAHAFVYGYDITSQLGREHLLQEIDKHIGLDSIALIHCNDSSEPLGSRIDKHEIPGKGLIGWDSLRSLVMDERLRGISLIMELPETNGAHYEQEILKLIKEWET